MILLAKFDKKQNSLFNAIMFFFYLFLKAR